MRSTSCGSGSAAGDSISSTLAVRPHDAVAHGGRGRDQAERVLALEPLLDDLAVQEAEEAAAEAEAERRARLGLVLEGGVVEPELLERGLERAIVLAVHRIETAEHHRLHFAEAGQRHARRLARERERVADPHLVERLDARDHHAHLARRELGHLARVRVDHVELADLVLAALGHQADAVAGREPALLDAHQHRHAHVGVEPGVEDQGARGRRGVADGRRYLAHDALEQRRDALPLLRGDRQHGARFEPDHVLDLLRHALGVGRRQVDLVRDRDQGEVGVEREVGVREGLRLDALRGVHHQERALAGVERARHLVGEVHVAGRVDQVQHVLVTVVAPGSACARSGP